MEWSSCVIVQDSTHLMKETCKLQWEK